MGINQRGSGVTDYSPSDRCERSSASRPPHVIGRKRRIDRSASKSIPIIGRYRPWVISLPRPGPARHQSVLHASLSGNSAIAAMLPVGFSSVQHSLSGLVYPASQRRSTVYETETGHAVFRSCCLCSIFNQSQRNKLLHRCVLFTTYTEFKIIISAAVQCGRRCPNPLGIVAMRSAAPMRRPPARLRPLQHSVPRVG